jgi:hypothetical protein
MEWNRCNYVSLRIRRLNMGCCCVYTRSLTIETGWVARAPTQCPRHITIWSMSISQTLTLSPIPHPPTSISITSSTKDSTPHYGLLLCVHTITNRCNRAGCQCTDALALTVFGTALCMLVSTTTSICLLRPTRGTSFFVAKNGHGLSMLWTGHIRDDL